MQSLRCDVQTLRDLDRVEIVERPRQAGQKIKPESRWGREVLDCYFSVVVTVRIRHVQGAHEERNDDLHLHH